jgi:hypothetical protein
MISCPTVLDDRVAIARGECVECFVPGGAFPLSFAAFAGAFEWIKNAIGIGYLVECGGPLAQLRPREPGMLGIAFELLNLARDFVDVSEQPHADSQLKHVVGTSE